VISGSEAAASELAGVPQKPRGLTDWRLPLAFLRRDLLISASYRFKFVSGFFSTALTVAAVFFIGSIVGRSTMLPGSGGSYFSFLMATVAFVGLIGAGTTLPGAIREAQMAGTMEVVMLSPAPLSVVIYSSTAWTYVMALVRLIAVLAAGMLIFHLWPHPNLLGALLIAALATLCLTEIGTLSAAFLMVVKNGDPLVAAYGALMFIGGGAIFPVTLLPHPVQLVSALLPLTYALRGIRMALSTGASMSALAPDIWPLLVFAVVLLPVSNFALRLALRQAKKQGSLAQY
jgi:ABC-2 type transport system permease protein